MLGGASLYTSYFRFTKNFYEVDHGKFFRSAQLTRSEFESAISDYGIKTVISLRGDPPALFGEERERETLERLGVYFHSFALEMNYFPSKKDLNVILGLYASAPKPILIHCRSGADRTGMMTALYAIDQMHESKEQAMEQLTPKYLHIKAIHPAMSEFVKLFQGRDWAQHNYDPCNYLQFKEHKEECVVQ